MSPERWQQVKAAFQDALDILPGSRREWLEDKFGADPELVDSVAAMLAQEESTAPTLEGPLEIPLELLERLAIVPNFEPGQVVAERFRIVHKLGQGGMGEVFEAHDLVSGERVAIKTVLTEMAWDERSHRQLEKEVETARRVSHHNVCRIHEIFQHRFRSGDQEYKIPVLSMELLNGPSLAARLYQGERFDEATVRAIAGALADALAAAHAKGVVHGDLKPANIILVSEKEGFKPVVTDFGLARRLAEASPGMNVVRGVIVGTPAYMAPEQRRGEEASMTSDVYAYGLVLYELVSGSAALPPAHSAQSVAAQAEFDPPPLRSRVRKLDSRLDRLIQRCLERDPAKRYPDAAQLRADLADGAAFTRRGLLLTAAGLVVGAAGAEIFTRSKAPEPPKRSIAVLPFQNSSNEPAADYIVDGLTAEVRRCIQRIPKLRVAAADSSRIANAASISLTEMGRQVGVTHLLMGSIRLAADRITTHVQVFDASTGLPVKMKSSFESVATTALSLEIEIAAAVAGALQLTFSGSERKLAEAGQTKLPEAHELYLQASHAAQTRRMSDLEKAGDLYLQALQKDPSFALAWVALANQRQALSGHPGYAFNDLVPEAQRYALRAQELAPDLPEALASLGQIDKRYFRNWKNAEHLFQLAIENNPNFTEAMSHLAGVYTVLGRHADALKQAESAVSLDPLSAVARNNYAYMLRNARRYDEALSENEKARRLNPNFAIPYIMGADIYDCLGQFDKARDLLLSAIQRFGEEPDLEGYLAVSLARCGQMGKASDIAGKLEDDWQKNAFFPSVLADIYCGLGERGKMYHWINVALREHDAEIDSIAVDPEYDRYRQESEFQQAMRELKLPDKVS